MQDGLGMPGRLGGRKSAEWSRWTGPAPGRRRIRLSPAIGIDLCEQHQSCCRATRVARV